jgi:hypothetical protein
MIRENSSLWVARNQGGTIGDLHILPVGKPGKLMILAIASSLAILFVAARSPIRSNSHFNSKSVGLVGSAESVVRGESRNANDSIRQTKREGSNTGKTSKELIWVKLDAEREKYEVNFSKDSSAGPGRGFWHNSKQVRFWTDLLSSEDPEYVEQAIYIIEGATWETARLLRDSKGSKASDREGYTREEWESHQIFHTLLGARSLLSAARNGAPIRESVLGGDTDDSLILNDARLIKKAFVPRLRDADLSKAAAAKSVIDLFTFDIFRDEPSEWWEAGSPLGETK